MTAVRERTDLQLSAGRGPQDGTWAVAQLRLGTGAARQGPATLR